MAEAGDSEPPESQWSDYLLDLGVSWLEAHFGIIYGHHPLINIAVRRWILCLLHMNLRIVGGMFNKLVGYQIGKYGDEEAQQKAIAAKLSEGAVWIREAQLEKKSKNLNAAFKKDISFVGCDAVSIVGLSEELMEIVCPAAARSKDAALQNFYDGAMECWNLWEELWRVLNNAIDSTDATARGARADEVQKLADAWLDAWVDVVGNTQGLYIHLLHAHLADWVRELGDLRPYQSQGLEHCHSVRKLIAKMLTNRQKYGKRSRTEQTLRFLLTAQHVRQQQRDNEDALEHLRKERAEQVKKEKRVKRVRESGRTSEKMI